MGMRIKNGALRMILKKESGKSTIKPETGNGENMMWVGNT